MLLMVSALCTLQAQNHNYRLMIGTYTNIGKGENLYLPCECR